MSELPKPLQTWSTALGLFPRHLALELGAWLPRLAMVLGPLRAQSTEGHDEPDGFDGLARRGPYERLLAAEWALAEEHPDEFIRRATSGEHAFFRLAFRAPSGQRRCLVLLDSGPSQLGTPRLAHLASLVVLERRAQEAKAEFLWGVLQQPPGRFLTGVTQSGVEHWLRARTANEPTPEDLAGWREAYGPGAPEDELWLLGGARLQRFEGASLLTVKEAGEALSVELRPKAAAQARRKVLLPLPSDEVCTQLIRDPLKREAPLNRGGRPNTNFLFVAGGSRLLYGTAHGLVTHIIPGAPGFASSPTSWPIQLDEEVVAAGWNRGLSLILFDGGRLKAAWYGKHGHRRGDSAWHTALPESVTGHGDVGHVKGVIGACVEAPGWRLVTSHGELVEMLPDRTYAVKKTNVAAVALHRGRLLTVERRGGDAYVEALPATRGPDVKLAGQERTVDHTGGARVHVQLFHPAKERVPTLVANSDADNIVTVRGTSRDAPVVFGFDNQAECGAAVGLQLPDGRWTVLRLRKTVDAATLMVPSGATVHGVAITDPGDEPGLLVVERDGCTIALCTGKAVMRVVRAASRIVRLGVSPFSSHFAYQDEGGLLCIYSMRRQQVVLRLLTDEEVKT